MAIYSRLQPSPIPCSIRWYPLSRHLLLRYAELGGTSTGEAETIDEGSEYDGAENGAANGTG